MTAFAGMTVFLYLSYCRVGKRVKSPNSLTNVKHLPTETALMRYINFCMDDRIRGNDSFFVPQLLSGGQTGKITEFINQCKKFAHRQYGCWWANWLDGSIMVKSDNFAHPTKRRSL
jgi:hypothetical protein